MNDEQIRAQMWDDLASVTRKQNPNHLLILGNPCGTPGTNPPAFVVIDSQSGVVQYRKVATKTGDEALRKAAERAQDMADKLGRSFIVFLDLHSMKVGSKMSLPMVRAMGVSEEYHPRTGNPGILPALVEGAAGGVGFGLAQMMMAKRGENPYAQTESDFIWFLEHRLIPDLYESGTEETAKTFEEGVGYARGRSFDKKVEQRARQYAAWLESTLIPDMMASGTVYTAKDLARLAKIIWRKYGRGKNPPVENPYAVARATKWRPDGTPNIREMVTAKFTKAGHKARTRHISKGIDKVMEAFPDANEYEVALREKPYWDSPALPPLKNPHDATGAWFDPGLVVWEADNQDEAYNALRILHENGVESTIEVAPASPGSFGKWVYKVHITQPLDSYYQMVVQGALNRIAQESIKGKLGFGWSSLQKFRQPRPKRKKMGILRERMMRREANPCPKRETEKIFEAAHMAYLDAENARARGDFPAVERAMAAARSLEQMGMTVGKPGVWFAPKKNPSIPGISRKQIERGMRHELEHTKSRSVARKIAVDHLAEDPRYYEKLARMHNPKKALNEPPPWMMQDPAFRAELEAYYKRHGRNAPVEIFRVKVPKGFPKFMTAYGHAPAALYDAHKVSNKGKRIHHFGEGGKRKPWLVSSQARGPKFLAYVGGDFKAKPDWLYD